MLRLAGEVADGVLLNYLPASIVPWCVEQVRKGGDAEILAYVHCGVTDRDRYAELARKDLLNYAVVDAYANQFARAGFGDDVAAFRTRWKAKERDAALAAIGDDWVDAIQIMGDADHVRAAVQAYADNGVDRTDRVRPAVGRGPPRDGQHDTARARARPNDRRSAPCRGRARGTTRRRWPRPRCRTPRRTRRASRSSPSASGRPSPSSITCFASPIATTAPLPSSAAQCSATCSDLVLRHDPVDEPDRERLVGAHLPPAPDQLLGARRADESGQPLRAARARDDAEQDLGLPDARVVGGDAQIARHRELEAAAERVAAGSRR